jgi:hypothetical protein
MTNLKTSLQKVRKDSVALLYIGLADLCSVDWAEEDTELPSGNQHLWEESWDDDETNDDFSKQLKYVGRYKHF